MRYSAKDEYPLPRDYLCDGTHASRIVKQARVVYDHEVTPGHHVTLTAGLTVQVCADPCCAHVLATCDHLRNTWDDTGRVLSCDFCGADGT